MLAAENLSVWSFRRKPESTFPLPWIPASAGMTRGLEFFSSLLTGDDGVSQSV
jgi:hypothetical protein